MMMVPLKLYIHTQIEDIFRCWESVKLSEWELDSTPLIKSRLHEACKDRPVFHSISTQHVGLNRKNVYVHLVSQAVKSTKTHKQTHKGDCLICLCVKCSSSSGCVCFNWRWKEKQEQDKAYRLGEKKIVGNRIVNRLPHKLTTAVVTCVCQCLSPGAVENSWMVQQYKDKGQVVQFHSFFD